MKIMYSMESVTILRLKSYAFKMNIHIFVA